MAKKTFDLGCAFLAALALSLVVLPDPAAAAGRKGGAPVQSADAFSLANSLAGHNLYKEAIVKYRQAIAANPRNPKIYHMYGRTLALMGLFNDAMDQYKMVLRLKPGPDADLEYDFGVAAAASGDNADGARHLKKAVTISPQHIAAYNNLGVTLSRLGDYKGAKDAFEISLRLQPTNKDIEKLRNELIAKLGDSKTFDYNAPPEPVRRPPPETTAEVAAPEKPAQLAEPKAAATPAAKPAAEPAKAPPPPPTRNAENTSPRPHAHTTAVEPESKPAEPAAKPIRRRHPVQSAADPSSAKPPVAVSGTESPPSNAGGADPSLNGVSTSLRNLDSDDDDADTSPSSGTTAATGTSPASGSDASTTSTTTSSASAAAMGTAASSTGAAASSTGAATSSTGAATSSTGAATSSTGAATSSPGVSPGVPTPSASSASTTSGGANESGAASSNSSSTATGAGSDSVTSPAATTSTNVNTSGDGSGTSTSTAAASSSSGSATGTTGGVTPTVSTDSKPATAGGADADGASGANDSILPRGNGDSLLPAADAGADCATTPNPGSGAGGVSPTK